MIDKLAPQYRILIATILSFACFGLYDYFVIGPQKQEVQAQAQMQKEEFKNSAPVIADKIDVIVSTDTPSNPALTQNNNIIATVTSENYELKIDTLGRIAKFYLNNPRYNNEDGTKLQLIDDSLLPLPLEIRFKDASINAEAFKTPYTTSATTLHVQDGSQLLTLTQKLEQVTVVKKLIFHKNGSYEINVELSQNQDYFITPGFRPNVVIDSYTFHGALIQQADGTIKTIDDGDLKVDERFIDAPMIAAVDRYYTTLFYDYQDGFDVVVTTDKNNDPTLFIKGKQRFGFNGYIGAKDYVTLEAINPKLTDVIEYGWFTFIAKPLFTLLSFLHGYLGNWGWSIVVMTILIRLVLYPLTYKGMVSMNKLKELAPKVKELQAKYKGEPQKLNTHMMELYKKHGANPMGGCLPIILQIPIFFAIYRVLLNAVELKSAPWILWIHDLSVMDPYFILPIAMGATMYLQQRITPTNFTDQMQEKIMRFLPLIFTFYFMTFPAGLPLYWLVNNLFSITQPYYFNKIFLKYKAQEIETGRAYCR